MCIRDRIWIAVSVYVLVAIVRKRLGLEATLYQILQILSEMCIRDSIEGAPLLTLFEKWLAELMAGSAKHVGVLRLRRNFTS